MNNDLQRYCLQTMGITQWSKRLSQKNADYVIFSDTPIDIEKEKLLERILQALKWPKEKVAIHYGALPIDAEIENQKILCFGTFENFTPHNNRILLPSLHDLLQNQDAKKQAWKLMQTFVQGS